MERQPRSSRQHTREWDGISLHGFTVRLCWVGRALAPTCHGQDMRPRTVQQEGRGLEASEPPTPTNISYSQDCYTNHLIYPYQRLAVSSKPKITGTASSKSSLLQRVS